jgi:methylated-DNA-[protein]-cysteine S-methyltransferase
VAPAEILQRARIGSPVGELTLFALAGRLVAVAFEGYGEWALSHLAPRPGREELDVQDVPDPAGAATALGRYFAGELDSLRGVEVDPAGTSFQKRVWAALCRIRPGKTISYADLALKIGQPRASRAVAQASARNPVPIFIPCHRVIGADGFLVGYGGGIAIKGRLLAHEGALKGVVESGDLFA